MNTVMSNTNTVLMPVFASTNVMVSNTTVAPVQVNSNRAPVSLVTIPEVKAEVKRQIFDCNYFIVGYKYGDPGQRLKNTYAEMFDDNAIKDRIKTAINILGKSFPLDADRIIKAIKNPQDSLNVIFRGWSTSFVYYKLFPVPTDGSDAYVSLEQFLDRLHDLADAETEKTLSYLKKYDAFQLGHLIKYSPEKIDSTFKRYYNNGWIDLSLINPDILLPQSREYVDQRALARNALNLRQKLLEKLTPEEKQRFEYNNQNELDLDNGELEDALIYYWQKQSKGPFSIHKICSLLGIDYIAHRPGIDGNPGFEDLQAVYPGRFVPDFSYYNVAALSAQEDFAAQDLTLRNINEDISEQEQYLTEKYTQLLTDYSPARKELLDERDSIEIKIASLNIKKWQKLKTMTEAYLKANNIPESSAEYKTKLNYCDFQVLFNFCLLIVNKEGRLRNLRDVTTINEIYQKVIKDSIYAAMTLPEWTNLGFVDQSLFAETSWKSLVKSGYANDDGWLTADYAGQAIQGMGGLEASYLGQAYKQKGTLSAWLEDIARIYYRNISFDPKLGLVIRNNTSGQNVVANQAKQNVTVNFELEELAPYFIIGYSEFGTELDKAELQKDWQSLKNSVNKENLLTRDRLYKAAHDSNDRYHVFFKGWTYAFIDWFFRKCDKQYGFVSVDSFIHGFKREVLDINKRAGAGNLMQSQVYLMDEVALKRNARQIAQKLALKLGSQFNETDLNRNGNPYEFENGELAQAIIIYWKKVYPGLPISIREVCRLLEIPYIEYDSLVEKRPGYEDMFPNISDESPYIYAMTNTSLPPTNVVDEKISELTKQLEKIQCQLPYIYNNQKRLELIKAKDRLETEINLLNLEKYFQIYSIRKKVVNANPFFQNEIKEYEYTLFFLFSKLLMNNNSRLRANIDIQKINEAYFKYMYNTGLILKVPKDSVWVKGNTIENYLNNIAMINSASLVFRPDSGFVLLAGYKDYNQDANDTESGPVPPINEEFPKGKKPIFNAILNNYGSDNWIITNVDDYITKYKRLNTLIGLQQKDLVFLQEYLSTARDLANKMIMNGASVRIEGNESFKDLNSDREGLLISMLDGAARIAVVILQNLNQPGYKELQAQFNKFYVDTLLYSATITISNSKHREYLKANNFVTDQSAKVNLNDVLFNYLRATCGVNLVNANFSKTKGFGNYLEAQANSYALDGKLKEFNGTQGGGQTYQKLGVSKDGSLFYVQGSTDKALYKFSGSKPVKLYDFKCKMGSTTYFCNEDSSRIYVLGDGMVYPVYELKDRNNQIYRLVGNEQKFVQFSKSAQAFLPVK